MLLKNKTKIYLKKKIRKNRTNIKIKKRNKIWLQATLINSFMVITDLFILFLSLTLLTTMIYDINCCDSKIIKFITTISLYVISFILFNHIIRGKEGKIAFNGIFQLRW